jgi:hypothetical protein
MKKLVFLLALASCGGSDNKTTPDTPAPMPDGPTGPDCFQGTAQSHEDLINACVDQSVTKIIKYPTLAAELAALPHLHPDGSIPILP